MAVDRCFKCSGKGSYLTPDSKRITHYPTALVRYIFETCDKCLGSGALDYRVVQSSPHFDSKGTPTYAELLDAWIAYRKEMLKAEDEK